MASGATVGCADPCWFDQRDTFLERPDASNKGTDFVASGDLSAALCAAVFYAPDPIWLPGIASAALILAAAVGALEKHGPEMSSESSLSTGR